MLCWHLKINKQMSSGNNMVGAIIQARMGSTRFPGKIMMDLSGKPVLWHVVERIKHAQLVDDVIIATTTLGEDDVVVEYAQKEGWKYYRGSKNNVLERYYYTAKHYGSKIVLRLLSDCPLIDPEIIDCCIDKFLEGGIDIVGDLSGVPRGMNDVDVLSFETLEIAYKHATCEYEKEHVVPYIWENKNGEFNVLERTKSKLAFARNYRLTLDYPEDLKVIRKIYDTLYKPGSIIRTEDVINFLDMNSDVAEMNAHCKQKSYKISAV